MGEAVNFGCNPQASFGVQLEAHAYAAARSGYGVDVCPFGHGSPEEALWIDTFNEVRENGAYYDGAEYFRRHGYRLNANPHLIGSPDFYDWDSALKDGLRDELVHRGMIPAEVEAVDVSAEVFFLPRQA